ncbi:Uncharacterized protein TCM_009398 [Theobroma cacao]|uniref:RNase H type-1 domain-containing protein n=1 Tax=Theobroma cacao TaxID=3641 RepID=A0A061E6N9_THECC|nr:Uncharacterized protein TCM_009398 [Theobroma cacao]
MHFDLFGQLRAKEAWDALYHGTFSLKYEKLISWDKPKSSFVKLNVDGSAKGQPGVAVAGGINRDENGVWLAGFAYNIGNFFFTHSRNTGFVSRVEVMLEDPNFHLLKGIKEILHGNWDCSLSYIHREANHFEFSSTALKMLNVELLSVHDLLKFRTCKRETQEEKGYPVSFPPRT